MNFKYKEQNETLFKITEGQVVDQWTNLFDASPKTAVNERKVFGWDGHEGKIIIKSTLNQQIITPGTNASIEVKIKNDSKKIISGLKVSFVRELKMLKPSKINFNDEYNGTKIIRQIDEDYFFKDKTHIFNKNETRSTNIYISIPVKVNLT